VSHHSYPNDQFCGLSVSLGPSQVTRLGSGLGLGRKDSGEGCRVFQVSCGGSVRLSSASKRDSSSRSASNFMELSSSSCMIVDVEACMMEGAALESVGDGA